MFHDNLIEEHFRLNPFQKSSLKKLGLSTIRDLLYYFPARYEEQGATTHISQLHKGDRATLLGRLLSPKMKKAFYKKIPMAEAWIEDETGRIKAIWYHQAYMAKKYPAGTLIRAFGTIGDRKGELYIANPEMREVIPAELAGDSGPLFGNNQPNLLSPIYSETRGISSSWIHHAISKMLSLGLHENLIDPLPPAILSRYHLPMLKTSLFWIHMPKNSRDYEVARKRFSFEEIFVIQLSRQRLKRTYETNEAPIIKTEFMQDFIQSIPFPLTTAQKKVIAHLVDDFKKRTPMSRLLEGDVGSGKTIVAAAGCYSAVKSGYEVAYMAPTEILARQHFESFITYFKHIGINIGLITSSECRKFPSKISPDGHTHISRQQLLKWVANGEIPIVIGTHSLIQKTVRFKKLALVIIDEQHRFGTAQRARLVGKNQESDIKDQGIGTPHFLSMTATPIPRTLALTIYGDLDLSLIDEMPPGRKPIITEIVISSRRREVYEKIRAELRAGRQAYVICPRIDEPDPLKELALMAKSAIAEAKKLKRDVFPEYRVEVLHSKLGSAHKEEVMRAFEKGLTNILVATSVVEVGVNIPNATVIMIEGAERFGLAQLHQLRGRVIRSNHQAYCYLFSESQGEKTKARLDAIRKARNGFELAELDLMLRGPGELSGTKQWGISDVGMEALKNIKMVEAARTEAQTMLVEDPDLIRHPVLKEKLTETEKLMHLE